MIPGFWNVSVFATVSALLKWNFNSEWSLRSETITESTHELEELDGHPTSDMQMANLYYCKKNQTL